MWFFYALLSAVFYPFRGLLEKRQVATTNKYILGLAIRLFALPFLFIPLIFQSELIPSPSQLTNNFWIPLLIISFVNTPIETIFYYEALREEELSLALPILSLGPALTLIFGSIFLKEVPTIFGALGVLSVGFGIYVMKIKHVRNGLLDPLIHLSRSRGVKLMIIVMVSQAVSSLFDKAAIMPSEKEIRV